MAEAAEKSARALPPSDRRLELISKSIRLQSGTLAKLGKPEEALAQLDRARALPLPDDSAERAGLYSGYARIMESIGEFGEAIRYFDLSYDASLATGNTRGQAIALGHISTVYMRAQQFERALDTIQRSLDAGSTITGIVLMQRITKADALTALNRFDEAEEEYLKALDVARAGGLPGYEQEVFAKRARLEFIQGNDGLARSLIDQALQLRESKGATMALLETLHARAAQEFREGAVSLARETVSEMFSGVDTSATTNRWMAPHETAYQIYEASGDHALALAHHKAFKRLNDEAKDLAANVNNAVIAAEFETSQKELEVQSLRAAQLESDAALLTAARRQAQIVAAGVSVLALSILGFMFWANRSARRTQRITQSLNNELELRNTALEKANQAKIEFLATTSHEVRTPLNAIIGLTDVVLEGRELPEGARDYLEVVNNSGRNLLAILNDILDISKLEAGRIKVDFKPLNIRECVLDVAGLWRIAAEDKGLDFKVDIDSDIGDYLCDEKLLRQIISNLLSNAIKFTPSGEVGLSLRRAPGSELALEVRDTGVGIAKDAQENIFNIFEQEKSGDSRAFGGSGLGLAICKKITEGLGGSISVKSNPGEGAVFTVTLPLSQSAALQEKEEVSNAVYPEQVAENELSVLRVLAAEDNSANALVLCAMLEGQVAEIKVVMNGEEALATIKAQPFDVILMDKQMPVLDGLAATKEIRALPGPLCSIPVIGLSAGEAAGVREQCLASGMNEFVTKPVSASELKAAILRVIKEKRSKVA